MDEYVKQSIEARKSAIFNAYKVGAGEKKKIDALFAGIEKLGAKCKDVGEFEAEFAKSPLNQQYMNLFTEIATSQSGMAEGVVEGVAESVATQVKNTVLPTRASVHQEVFDAARDVPVLGDVIDIKQKAGYVAHLGRMFGKGKKNKDEEE